MDVWGGGCRSMTRHGPIVMYFSGLNTQMHHSWEHLGILSPWDIVRLDIVPLGFCPHGILSSWVFVFLGFCPLGYCPMGFCPVGFCPRTELPRVIWRVESPSVSRSICIRNENGCPEPK